MPPAKKRTAPKKEPTTQPTEPTEPTQTTPEPEPPVAPTEPPAKKSKSPKKKAKEPEPTPEPEPEPMEQEEEPQEEVVVVNEKKRRKKSITQTKKRGPSSYVLFSMEHRKNIIKEDPTMGLGDVSKKCGEAWKELDETTKDEWRAKADKIREEIKQEYEAANPPKKKRTPSNYILFSIDYRKKLIAETPDMSIGECSKKCGAVWATMTEEQKNEWKAKPEEAEA